MASLAGQRIAACQWLNSAGQRTRLQALLRVADLQPDDLAAKLASVFHGTGRVAQLRRKTLQIVVDSLGLVEAAVRCVVSLIGGASELASRDTDLARSSLAARTPSSGGGG